VLYSEAWFLLIQMGLHEEAIRRSAHAPPPPPAPFLWRDDPKGLDMVQASGMPASRVWHVTPLIEAMTRVYHASGRARELAALYRASAPRGDPLDVIRDSTTFDHVAPDVALALRAAGDEQEAHRVLAAAEPKWTALGANGRLRRDDEVMFARLRAVQGRREEAVERLARAVADGWLPRTPFMIDDIQRDPAFAQLRDLPQFQAIRQRILALFRRERSEVEKLLQLRPEKAAFRLDRQEEESWRRRA
jgi:hypothetical protein